MAILVEAILAAFYTIFKRLFYKKRDSNDAGEKKPIY